MNNKIVREVLRVLPILISAILLLISDKGGLSVILYMVGILLLIAAVSHILRKILFPYIDLKLHTDKALESPASAGMVFMGVSFILGVMIYSGVSLLK